jgi:hypothetical protein
MLNFNTSEEAREAEIGLTTPPSMTFRYAISNLLVFTIHSCACDKVIYPDQDLECTCGLDQLSAEIAVMMATFSTQPAKLYRDMIQRLILKTAHWHDCGKVMSARSGVDPENLGVCTCGVEDWRCFGKSLL